MEGCHVAEVEFYSVPAYLAERVLSVEVPGLGTIVIDERDDRHALGFQVV